MVVAGFNMGNVKLCRRDPFMEINLFITLAGSWLTAYFIFKGNTKLHIYQQKIEFIKEMEAKILELHYLISPLGFSLKRKYEEYSTEDEYKAFEKKFEEFEFLYFTNEFIIGGELRLLFQRALNALLYVDDIFFSNIKSVNLDKPKLTDDDLKKLEFMEMFYELFQKTSYRDLEKTLTTPLENFLRNIFGFIGRTALIKIELKFWK